LKDHVEGNIYHIYIYLTVLFFALSKTQGVLKFVSDY